uniref:Uncharacterized protein n=1 Tax=Sphaerodactylus townsendi TaxID=933632 RepID=A0ACB8FLX8_9SAUR
MLSRLSGLANTVLQELSGDGENAEIGALPAPGPELEPSQQNGEETAEDVLERLAHMEKLVVQLKGLVREKDAELQQKNAVLQEERQTADAKLAKLKLQAKAKVASLNKRIEELTEQVKGLPEEPLPPCKGDQEPQSKRQEETEALQKRLQEQEAEAGKLQEQLEEATGSLRAAQIQLSSLQRVIQEKDGFLEEQARQHQAELHQLAAQSTLEAEMQQNLRLLQRKLEEQEAALLGRTQVVELLQQELNSLEEQKQLNPGGGIEELPAGENGHPDVLQYLSAKKRKDLSVLLVELQEAQEEIAFLKGQIPAPGEDAQLRGGLQASAGEEGGEGEEAWLIRSDPISSLSPTVEIPEAAPPLAGIPSGQGGLLAEGLHGRLQESEEGPKEAEAERLQQPLADSGADLHALTPEREQPPSPLKELCSPADLKEELRQAEGDPADSEQQLLSNYASGISQLSLLEEQIQSLKNEAGSKEVKIEALQRDLDEAQRRLTEQDLLASSLRSQLQEEEREGLALAGRLQEASAEAEELSQSIASKDAEADRLQKLVSERTAQVERLQQAVAEREGQLAEVSTSMSDRMVQLNEEKFALGQELKGLRERLSQSLQGKETRDLGVGTAEEPGQRTETASSAGEELEALRKENEQVRKKLQAALVSRKELLSKIRKMEERPEGGERQPAESKALEVRNGGPSEISTSADREVGPESRGPAAPLSQSLPDEEAEAQLPRREKESAVAELQAVIAELRQRLQEKDSLIGALEAKAEDRGKQLGLEGHPPEPGQEEQWRAAMEEKVSALEQEKENLQKKLEALTSQEDTMKKAPEKEGQHREPLRPQQEDSTLPQGQFEEQSKEKESFHGPFWPEPLENSCFPEPGVEDLQEGPQEMQEPGPEAPAVSETGQFAACRSSPAADDVSVEQIKADLEKLQAEKGELEVQLHRLEGELRSKSEEAQQLQEQTERLLAEAEAAKAASHQAEVSAMRLRAELEESQAELARLDGLRLHQASQEEQKELAREEEIEALRLQLVEKTESLHSFQAQLQESEEAVKALQGQLERQAQEQAQHSQAELAETQQKSEEQPRTQLQRKLQAALISRKEALRETRLLQEELADTRTALQEASQRLSEAESRAHALEKEKGALREKLEAVAEERGKLIAEVDKALVENQNLSDSCESLKLALEGVTQEKARLERDLGARQSSWAEELSEWQRRHQELQKEYETLLQSYENINSGRGKRQRIHAAWRTGKSRQGGAEREMEGMREKMRKFAKSKQQKILELEEENERLRAEALPPEGGPAQEEEMSARLRAELESAKESGQALSRQLEALAAEKDSLSREICGLKEKLRGQAEEAGRGDVPGEILVQREAAPSSLGEASEASEGKVDSGEAPEAPELAAVNLAAEEEEGKAGPSRDDINGYIQQVAQLTRRVEQLELMRRVEAEKLDRVLVDVKVLAEEKRGLEEELAAKAQELAALQERALGLERAHQQAEEQLASMAGLKEALEAEKDDLEERLMNQLAELNGSIGNYQQDVAELRGRNRQLLDEAEALRGALGQLEDEKRRLAREKADAVAEKKEHVEKLRSAWKGGSGRTQAKELQELLKAKQQEVRQLQKDCIKSQEKISSLERTIKALEFVQSESQKELEAARRSLAKAGDDTKKVQAELSSCRVLLDDTQSEAARVLAESLKTKEELQASKEQLRAQLRRQDEELERRLVEEKGKHAKELRNLEEKLEAQQKERSLSAGVARGLQEALAQKAQEATQLQGSLNQALAQLAAFTRSMSSLQDDRDRVIDQSREWEKKFSEAIEKKEQQVQAKERACAALEDQVKQAVAQVEELRIQVTSLENSKLASEANFKKELQRLQEEAELLKKENTGLALQLGELRQSFSDSQNRLQKQASELQGLREQLAGVQRSLAECQEAREETEKVAKRQEADLRECRFRQEQLERDLRSSKELTDKLHEEISSQEQKMIGLLAAREEAVAAALSASQQRHEEALKEMENRVATGAEERAALEDERRRALEKADRLLEKLKGVQEESRKHKAQLDSFTKSMSSLQDDRDRVLGDYQQLEQRHLSGMLEKDQLIQEAAAENNGLREEIRGLHGRVDDLHAENAKLDAELTRYREDLNQLISIKDSQQKQLSRVQLGRIQALEKEKAAAEGLLQESQRSAEALSQSKHQLEQEVKGLLSSLSQLQAEVGELQAQADEAQELSGQLSLARQQVAELEEELGLVRQATTQQLQEAEARMKEELKSLRHDAGLMRNETETAEERVAELAKDLLETEQSLLAATEENQDLKAQLQSFGKAMSSLQDSWDQANEELCAVDKKYAGDLEEQRALVRSLQEQNAALQGELKALAEERAALASELAALRDSGEGKHLRAQREKLAQQLQARDLELLHLTSELEGASGQVEAFSKAMASLQDERDHLLSQLDRSHREHEAQLQTTPGSSAGIAEAQSLKRALSSLQSDRERLLAELKSLQQQAGVDAAELARLEAQLEEQKREAERQQHLQEQMRQEMQQLREERAAEELSHAQAAVRETRPGVPSVEVEQLQREASPEAASGWEAETTRLQAQLKSSLTEMHQKEMRIQRLNSKLSQVFEEKNALSLQLRGSSRSLQESQQRYSDVLAHCASLEKQLQQPPPGKATGSLSTDAAPGAPQEISEHPRESYTPELQELQMRLLAAKEQESSAKEGLLQLEELLQEERERRRAAEEAFSAAQDHIRRLESSEWAHSLETSIDMPPSPEHALLVGSAEGTFSKPRQSSGHRRLLRSLFCSRTRLPLLATVYLLTIHVLLLLCFTGHL